MGFSVGWDSPQLFTLTFVSTGLSGAVWWAGGGQELRSHPTEAGGGSGNLSSRSPSILQPSKKCWPRQDKDLLKEGAGGEGINQIPSWQPLSNHPRSRNLLQDL